MISTARGAARGSHTRSQIQTAAGSKTRPGRHVLLSPAVTRLELKVFALEGTAQYEHCRVLYRYQDTRGNFTCRTSHHIKIKQTENAVFGNMDGKSGCSVLMA